MLTLYLLGTRHIDNTKWDFSTYTNYESAKQDFKYHKKHMEQKIGYTIAEIFVVEQFLDLEGGQKGEMSEAPPCFMDHYKASERAVVKYNYRGDTPKKAKLGGFALPSSMTAEMFEEAIHGTPILSQT